MLSLTTTRVAGLVENYCFLNFVLMQVFLARCCSYSVIFLPNHCVENKVKSVLKPPIESPVFTGEESQYGKQLIVGLISNVKVLQTQFQQSSLLGRPAYSGGCTWYFSRNYVVF